MQSADLIQKILRQKRLSQAELAGLLGVNQSQVTRWLAGSEPGSAACLLLASLADTDEERTHWMGASNLTRQQMLSIASVLKATPPTLLAGKEIELLSWWRDPRGAVEKSLKDFVEQMIKVRAKTLPK